MKRINGGRWLAEQIHDLGPNARTEKGAHQPEAHQSESEPPAFGPLYSRAQMDGETVALLASWCGCGVRDFERRYTSAT
jgi:hypothetical protein